MTAVSRRSAGPSTRSAPTPCAWSTPKNRVWAVNVAGGKATQESTLSKGPWVFTNGFNRNTGEPYMESIDSDATKPAGNGPADTSPVTRDGGTVLANDSAAYGKLPASPCRLGAGFVDANGVTWAFCADQPTVTTYYLPKDGSEVDRLRQAEPGRGTHGREFRPGAASRHVNQSPPVDILAR